jgi:hypothetical protein
VLKAHPTVLRELLAQYAALRDADDDSRESRRQLDDVSYTLCILTGTRNIEAATATARHDLSSAASRDGSTASSTALGR